MASRLFASMVVIAKSGMQLPCQASDVCNQADSHRAQPAPVGNQAALSSETRQRDDAPVQSTSGSRQQRVNTPTSDAKKTRTIHHNHLNYVVFLIWNVPC